MHLGPSLRRGALGLVAAWMFAGMLGACAPVPDAVPEVGTPLAPASVGEPGDAQAAPLGPSVGGEPAGAVGGAAGTGPSSIEGPSRGTASASSSNNLATAALASLAKLEIAPRTSLDGYVRTKFGDGWQDLDGNGCTPRNEVLARDLDDVRLARNGCTVVSGVLRDPYSGAVVDFVAGPATSPAVQIDHVVALADAWRTGAQGWDESTRIAFANDFDNLVAVSEASNTDKGSRNAANWLPGTDFVCEYVERQVLIKARYGLWVTQAEHDALDEVLAGC